VKFHGTTLGGVILVEVVPQADERGYFARTFCEKEFPAAGLPAHFVQNNISYNKKRGTLRGMHFQKEPHPEGKLVSCPRGKIFDVALDLRPSSPTFRQWAGFELSEENHSLLYIPPGFAHGFQTLEDDSVVSYQMTEFHFPELSGGVRWDDPAFAIQWPVEEKILSPRDRSFPDFGR
jgi:dTDP-4-dehydrorhamnose 3,5-epimerase